MFGRFNTNKCKTQCKLCIGRVKLMRNKRQIAMKQMRREVAELLKQNKQENARIRVEAVIREQNMLQAYEVLEIFLELLTVRLQMVEKSNLIPSDMLESLSSLVYAAPRIQDFPELVSIRGMLGQKFGKEFVEQASSDGSCRQWMVNENLIRCLSIGAPDPEVKLALLSDIAQEHSVEWDMHRASQEMLPGAQHQGYVGQNGPSPPPSGFPPPGNFGGGGSGGGGYHDSNMQQQVYVPPGVGPPTNYVAPYEGGVTTPVLPPSNSGSPQSKIKNIFRRTPSNPKMTPPSTQQDAFGLPPGGDVSAEEWRDAASAATAAREYSQKAQSAADAAQRYASSSLSDPGVDLGAKPAPTPPSASQPNLNYADIRPGGFTPMSSNPPNLPGAGGPAAAAPPPTTLPVDTPATGGMPQYRQRTDEEIQRAYDAVPGPPSKGGPPSAPPAPSRDPSPTVTARSDSQNFGLPSPPGAPATDAAPTKPDDEFDVLAARFDALKRK